ncbi:MAG: hypothetical protein ACRD2R_01830, partial [Terriglobales bacterium]
MTEKNKQPEFTVADRRKFTSEGERRTSHAEPVEAPEKTPAPAPVAVTQPPDAAAVATPLPPSAAEQQAQHDAYRATGKRLDPYAADLHGQRPQDFEVTFERFVASL